jgi:hypothetical protein
MLLAAIALALATADIVDELLPRRLPATARAAKAYLAVKVFR